MRLFLICGGKLSVPLEWTGILGTFLICTKGYKYPVTYQEGMWHFSRETLLWKKASSRVEGKSRGFSRVVAGSLGFISSCDGDLMDRLVLPQRSQVPFRVLRGPSGFLSSHCPRIGLCLDFSRETQCSSPVVTGISGFL